MAKYDVNSGVSNAASGAATGSVFGPVGTVAGGIAGAASGFFGKKKKKKRSTFDKKQKRLNEQQYDALEGNGPLADLYDYNPEKANEVFDKNIAAYEYRNLNEEGIPAVTGQFRSKGLQNSSYAADAVSKLVRNVQEKLAAERSKYLYSTEQESRNAKRTAVENLQNRNTFAYDNTQGANRSAGSKVNDIISSVDSEAFKNGVEDFITKYLPGGV